MPFYDYRCRKCHAIVEKLAPVEKKKMKHHCGGTMDRLISAPQFKFSKKKVDITHSERRKRWNSPDPKDKI